MELLVWSPSIPVALLHSRMAPTARVVPSAESATALPKDPVLLWLALKYPMACVRSGVIAAVKAPQPLASQARRR